ncbi:MAG: hypothetical protein WBA07_33705 [Rivularia sp. (in: cyanobacteria)]
MGQTRFTLNPKIKSTADELLKITGSDSYSNLLNLLITRYGQHLKQTWMLLPATPTQVVHQIEASTSEEESTKFYHQQQSTEPSDPVIARLAGLLETF